MMDAIHASAAAASSALGEDGVGGSGWMSLGTMTRSRPRTRMAPEKEEGGRGGQMGVGAGDPHFFDVGSRPPTPPTGTGRACKWRKRGGKGAHSHSAPPLTRIVGRAAVVGRRKQGDQVPLRKPLKPVHHALVRAHDELQVVVLAERFDAVGPKRDEARPARARLHTLDRVVGGGVRPQQVHQHDAAVLHGQGALQGTDLVDAAD